MSTSDRSFNQVKAILNKLDRAVDEARQKRTTPPPPPPPAANPTLQNQLIGVPQNTQPAAQPTQAPTATPARPPSQFGRAQPIRPATPINPNNQTQPLRWGTTGR